MYESCPSYQLLYTYDAYGNLSSIRRILANGVAENYGVYCNIFGDVIAIYYSNDGSLAAKYTYDSWGKLISVKDLTNNDIMGDNDIWTQNSIRYRGYVYDEDTQIYYLQSRYYDPETCRFINADDASVLAASPTALTDKNLFTYCDCNPLVRADNEGEFWHILAGAGVGAIVNMACYIACQVIDGAEITGGQIAVSLVSGAIGGALTAVAIPPIVSPLLGGALSALEEFGYQVFDSKPGIDKQAIVIAGVTGLVCDAFSMSGSLKSMNADKYVKSRKEIYKVAKSAGKANAKTYYKKMTKTIISKASKKAAQAAAVNTFASNSVNSLISKYWSR